jgi:serine/threonine protein kinase
MCGMNPGGPRTRLVDGRFELLERLGGGGMGLVWRARDTALDREVAVKEVRPPDAAMAEADPDGTRQLRDRVLREAKALARLQHPNVVIIHHIVDSREHPFPWLVMELVRGGTLGDRLDRGPLQVPEAARLGRGVLGALRAAHAAGVQHRDVKPGNVLLRPDGTPVLTDFGIAAVHGATALTATGALIGSPEYIAPERIRGVEGNPSSDLWSLAMMLYVAVEGTHPLRRGTSLATLAAVLDEPLPPPARAGALGPALAAILAKDPAARPDAETFDRMLAAAEAAPSGYGYPAAPVPGAGPGPATPPPLYPPHTSGTPYPSGTPQPLYPQADAAAHRDAPPPSAYGGGAGWAPPAPGAAGTPHPGPAPRPTRAGRRRGPVTALLSVGSVTAVGVLVWVMLPYVRGSHAGDHSGGSPVTTTSAAGAHGGVPSAASGGRKTGSPTTGSTGSTGASAGQDGDASHGTLLTPAGVRQVVAAFTPHIAGNKILSLTVYETYAIAEAPTPEDPSVYDDLTYRDGQVTTEPGGTMKDATDPPVSLSVYHWDAVTALMSLAQQKLNVPHPKTRYLIIGSDIIDETPTIMVYLSDDYGSGFLTADPRGKVTDTHPK